MDDGDRVAEYIRMYTLYGYLINVDRNHKLISVAKKSTVGGLNLYLNGLL